VRYITACLTLALAACAAPALAQASYRPGNWAGYGVPGQQYGFGGPVAGHHRHASTAFEGMCRGVAAVTQARAQYNLLTSLAMLNAAQADRLQAEADYWRQQAALEKQAAKQAKLGTKLAKGKPAPQQAAQLAKGGGDP
jgi:hypothetical protein